MSGSRVGQQAQTFSESGYWFTDDQTRAVTVLNALRRYRQAERDMRARTQTSMKMGETDLAAIRFLLREQRAERPVSSTALARHLGITTASTAVLINRLSKSGHIVRHPNPADKRGVLLTATGDSDDEVRATMAGMHARMILAAEKLPVGAAAHLLRFLDEMTQALDESVPVDPLADEH